MQSKKLSIGMKISSISAIILLLFGFTSMFLSYFTIKKSNLSFMNNELVTITSILASGTDVEKIKSIINNPSTQNSDALEFTAKADHYIKDSKNTISNIYLTTLKNNRIYYPAANTTLLSGFTYGSEYTEGGSIYNLPIKKAYSTNKVQTTEIFSDSIGTWKSGFAPIIDENGEIIALLSADFDVSKVKQKAWSETLPLIALSIVFFLISIMITLFSVKKMIAPVQKLSKMSKQLSNGDLSVKSFEIRNNDEINELGASFNKMVGQLKGIIEQVNHSANNLAISTKEIAESAMFTSEATDRISHTIQEIAIGTNEQASIATEAKNAVTEISKGMKQVSSAVQVVVDLSKEATNKASNGEEVVRNTMFQMETIQQKVLETSEVILILSEKSKEIDSITNIINDLTNKTNLLALNASIEAARAGEHGHGFAVVANEVQKLAKGSKMATQNILEVIEEIQAEISQAVNRIEEGSDALKNGIIMVQNTGESFNEIFKIVQEVDSKTNEVSAVSEEVSISAQAMREMMESIAVFSEQTASSTQNVASSSEVQNANMEEVTASTSELSNMAQELKRIIQKFTI